MHKRPILPLIVGLSLWACGDPAGPADGTMAISTSTSGEDRDTDGFQLTIDGVDSLALLPSGTTEVDLPPGRHSLRLFGVAEHCSIAPGTAVEVDITAGRTTPVAFQVSCPGTSIRVGVTTTGQDPDQDGYQLTIDAVDALALDPTGTAEVDVAPGRHTLQLQGVAEQCSVTPGTVLELDFARGSTTPVVYDVDCPLTGARITVTTANGDLDVNGYSVKVDGTDRGVVLPNGALAVRLDPGGRTVTLTGLPPNCTIDGPASRRVTIVDNEAVPIEFAVVCTGSRTIRLTIVSHVYPELTPRIPVQIILDGKVHDIQVPLGSSTFHFGGLGRGMHSLAAQFRRYPISEWIRCQRHPGWNGPPVSTVEADTTEVRLELVSTVHCHFL
jgi:hypothetical protein